MYPVELWRLMMSKVHTSDAIRLDVKFTGGKNMRWIVRNSNLVPDRHMWLESLKADQFHMLYYLERAQIVCNDLAKVIQYAADNAMVYVLRFFYLEGRSFYKSNATNSGPVKITRLPMPVIDKIRDVKVFEFFSTHFCDRRIELIQNPRELVCNLLLANDSWLLTLTVPKLVNKVSSARFIGKIARRGNHSTLYYALEHAGFEYLDDEVMVEAAKGGNLPCYRLLESFRAKYDQHTTHPAKAMERAFSYGHIRMFNYMLEKNPNFMPSKISIEWACEYGHLESVKILGTNVEFRDVYSIAACRSGCKDLVVYIVNTFGVKFREDHVIAALASDDNSTLMTVILYYVKECLETQRTPALSDQFKHDMLCNPNMNPTSVMLHTNGIFDLFTESVFRECCAANPMLAKEMIDMNLPFTRDNPVLSLNVALRTKRRSSDESALVRRLRPTNVISTIINRFK